MNEDVRWRVACSRCHAFREPDTIRDGLCFRCRIKSLSFTFRGAHPGRRGWHEDTVANVKREIYDGARQTGTDITRA